MRYLAFVAIVAASTSTPAIASPALAICHQPYALCASSPTVAIPGETVKVNGKEFQAGVSVCPVLKGPSIADLNLMHGSCSSPDLSLIHI